MKIALLAPLGDPETAQLAGAIESIAPDSLVRLSLFSPDFESILLDADRIYWNGHDFSLLDAIFLRGFAYWDPVIPDGEIDRDWSLWRCEYLALQQRYSAVVSLLEELARRGLRLINPPTVHLRLYAFPALLSELFRKGIAIPEFLCTNNPEEAFIFAKFSEARALPDESSSETSSLQTLWRPASGRGPIQLYGRKQHAALMGADKPPILLFRLYEGPLYRSYVAAGQSLLTLQWSYPSLEPPESLGYFWEVDPPSPAWLSQLSEMLSIPWFHASYVVPEGGSPLLYDLDTDPHWEGIPRLLQDRLVTRLAAWLTNRASSPSPLVMKEEAKEGGNEKKSPPCERPTLFLRRMLRILFEFEASKYRSSPKDSR